MHYIQILGFTRVKQALELGYHLPIWSYRYIFSPPLLSLDYVQCPYCQRRFNESAADRHIKFCQEQAARMPNKSKLGDSKKPPGRTQVRTNIDCTGDCICTWTGQLCFCWKILFLLLEVISVNYNCLSGFSTVIALYTRHRPTSHLATIMTHDWGVKLAVKKKKNGRVQTI